jgi:hypothetical protein
MHEPGAARNRARGRRKRNAAQGDDPPTLKEQHADDERQMLAEMRGNQFVIEPGSIEEEP